MTGRLVLLFTLAGQPLQAQGTREDYDRARSLGARFANTVFRTRIEPKWLEGGTSFWYRVETAPGAREYVFVDAASGRRRPLFDHKGLARILSGSGGKVVSESRLAVDAVMPDPSGERVLVRAGANWWRFDAAGSRWEKAAAPEKSADGLEPDEAPRASENGGGETVVTFVNRTPETLKLFWLDTSGNRRSYGILQPGDKHSQHTFAGHVWLVTTERGAPVRVFKAEDIPLDAEITTAEPMRRKPPEPPTRSRRTEPSDRRWTAFVRDHNIWIRETATAQETALTRDGKDGDGYGEPIRWSPDGSRFVAMKRQSGEDRKIHFVESSPRDQLQPRLHTRSYAKPGDRIDVSKPRLFDPAARKEIPIPDALFANPWSLNEIRWSADSKAFTFLYNQRGHQILRIVEVDAATGAARALVDEQSPTFIDYAGKFFRHNVDKTGELIWMSERDGWNHLYLYDLKAGKVKNAITHGEWVVLSVERVDEEARQVWFWAGGIRPGQDPYHRHLARANFDGTGLVVLTEGDGTHAVDFSPDRRFFVDRWSRVDLPPVHELRRTDDGRLVCPLETADASALKAAGWTPPERFVAKGRDGVTDVYGIIIRPTTFDPKKKYPVIENIYAGPQDSFVPKSFQPHYQMQDLAELGFVLVKIDGMGTSNRSKKFHDVCWKNLVDAGLADRVLWMKAAAADRPWMDLSRVGIYGGSAGGQNALGALLTHGDFYKAAAADCGCHDNRMDKIWWNELWMGWPIGPHYAEQSNVTLAKNLKGKLLLTVGELDDNVDPASTMQVVNALIKADKDFELLVLPGAKHGAGESPYGRRRRADFFVRHLLGVEPRAN